MDPRLAEIYHTNEDTSDVEKTAAAELAEKLASSDEVDIDGMSAEEIEALAKDVLSPDEEKTEEPAAEEATEDKTAEAKFQEADYMGRVMAHAYVNELKEIDNDAAEKTAGPRLDKAKGVAKEGLDRLKGAVAMNKTVGKATEHVGKHKKKYLAGAAAAGGFGAGRMSKGKSKKAAEEQTSALDTLAVERAKEILVANGYELNEQAEEKTEEKQAAEVSKYDALANAVEARAVELLKAEGYKFEDAEEKTEE